MSKSSKIRTAILAVCCIALLLFPMYVSNA